MNFRDYVDGNPDVSPERYSGVLCFVRSLETLQSAISGEVSLKASSIPMAGRMRLLDGSRLQQIVTRAHAKLENFGANEQTHDSL